MMTDKLVAILIAVAMALPAISIQAQAPAMSPAPVTAFVNVNVIPMDRERVLPNQTVLVRGSRIAAIGPANKVKVPRGALQVDGHGKFLLPGLADMHAHVHNDSGQMVPQEQRMLRSEYVLLLYLANGITTIRSMGDGWPPAPFNLRDRVARGEVLGPRIYAARDQLDAGTIPTPEVAKRIVAEHKAGGYDFIKLHGDPQSREVFDTLVAAARRAGVPLAGHTPESLPSGGVGLADMLQARVASIEHLSGYWEALIDSTRLVAKGGAEDNFVEAAAVDLAKIPRLAAATRRAGVWNCPTQSIAWSNVPWRNNPDSVRKHEQDDWGKALTKMRRVRQTLIKALQDAGAGLLLGTDARPPFPLAEELELFVEAGLTPYQALATGTRNVAKFFGTLDSTGTIAVGKRADLVLLTGNPLENVRAIVHPVGTMIGGHWLSREDFKARLTTANAPISDTWW